MDKTNQFQKNYPPPEHGYIPEKNINEDNSNKLFMAAAKCDINELKLAISTTNLPFDVVRNDGQTLIHTVLKDMVTSEKSKYNILEYLLINNAPCSVHDKNNITPLHLAAKYQYQSIIKLLLKYGADVNALDSSDMSPLHYLVQNNIRDCKKKKYVGDIIPKSENDIRPADIQDMTGFIIELLNTKYFTNYVEHMRNIFKSTNLEEMYYETFQKKENMLLGDLAQSISNPKSKDEMKRGNLEQLQNYKSSLIQHISGKIRLSNIKIENDDSQNINDIDVKNPNDIVKLMNSEYDPKDYGKNESQMNDDKKEVLDSFDVIVDQIEGQINDMTEMKKWVYFHTIGMSFKNHYAKLNEDIKIRAENKLHFVDTEKMKKLLLDTYRNIEVPDITVIHENAFDGKFMKKENFLMEFWEIDNEANQIKLARNSNNQTFPLTDDNLYPLGGMVPVPIVGQHAINNRNYFDPRTNNTRPGVPNHSIKNIFDTFGLDQFYFYKLSYYSERIESIWETIKINIKNMTNLVNDNNVYYIYTNILISMYEALFNMTQNLLYLKNNIGPNQLRAKKILNEFEDKVRDTERDGHPYKFLIKSARDNAREILTVYNDISIFSNKLYSNCVEFVDKLNSVVDYINAFSFDKFVSSVYKEKFNSNTIVDVYKNLFHKEIPQFVEIPNDFTEYQSLFRTSIPGARSKYYSIYAPKVNEDNYLFYLSDNIDVRGTDPYYYSHGFEEKKYNNILEDKDRKSKYGFIYDVRRNLTVQSPPLGEFFFGILYYNPHKIILNQNPIIPHDVSGKHSIDKYITTGDINTVDHYKPRNQKNLNVGNTSVTYNESDNYHGSISVISDIGGRHIDGYTKTIALPIVKNRLHDHIYNLKYIIIKNLLDVIVKLEQNKELVGYGIPDGLKETIKRKLDDIKKKEYINQSPVQVYLSIVLVADKFLDDFVKVLISNGVTSHINGPDNTRTITTIFQQVFEIGDKGEILRDTKFSFNFNEFFETIINTYLTSSTSRLTDNLLYTMNLIDEEDDFSEQHIIYNTNYDLEMDSGVQKCYKVKPKIVKMMVEKYGADVNLPDITKSTPLYYAIVSLNEKIIDVLIDNGANVVLEELDHVSNNPYFHFVSLFRSHIGIRKPSPENLIQYFTKRMTKRVVNEITNDDDFKNNVIKFIGNIFPQMILMYNHLFYFYMKSYINGWSFSDNKKLEEFFIKCGCINMNGDSIDYQLPISKNIVLSADKYIPTSTLNTYKDRIDKEINLNKKNIENYNNILSSLNDEKNELENRGASEQEIANINKKIIEIRDKKFKIYLTFQKKDSKINNDMKNINENIVNQINLNEKNIEENTKKFDKYNNTNLKITDSTVTNPTKESLNLYKEPHIIYDDFFKEVICKSDSIHKSKVLNIYNDHMMYNASWENIILNNGDRTNNIHHIHLLTVNMYYRCLDRIKKTKNIEEIKKCNELFKVLKKLHTSIFCPAIRSISSLKQEYNFSKNHTLTAIMDIMIHTSKHVIFSNIYYGIIKVMTKYMLSRNPSTYVKDKIPFEIYKNKQEKYKEYVIKVVQSIIKGKDGGDENKLYKHIVERMPKKIVKMYMGVYKAGEKKVDNMDNEIEMLFQDITGIITSNGIDPDSGLIKILDKYIYRYYKKIISIIIPKMKIVFDNYNRYIINEGKLINIMVRLTDQFIKESREIENQKNMANRPIVDDSPERELVGEELEEDQLLINLRAE